MRRIVYGGVFVSLGVLLPALFHLAGLAGQIFLPMHIPVLMAGLTLGPLIGAAVGILTPVLSFALTGMPPVSPPILPMMAAELATYAAVAGWLSERMRSRLVPLVVALVAGRLTLGVMAWVAGVWLGFQGIEPISYVVGSVVTGLPGIILQIVGIPIVTRLLRIGPAGLKPAQDQG